MNAAGRKIAISPHIEIEWLENQTTQALCPNCGCQGEVRQILDMDYCPPIEHDDEHRFILQVCPVCSVRFVDNMQLMQYDNERLIEFAEHAYHVQLGAGIWAITGQLARVDKPAGTNVLEIGGAYGFGLDFCIRARGWDGVGYDPSPFVAFGMQELGLKLRQEYFTVRQLKLGPWDVAIATELLEHVCYPAAFLLLMRRALGDTGMLVLSTPDAEWITPDLPHAALAPLLSPASHAVLQTEQSLGIALRAAGFSHVHIIRDGMSLIAYASAAPFELLTDDGARRAMYRNYLVERARLAELTSDLRLGFAGRGIFEAANDGDWQAADAAWAALLPAAKARFGLDLETMTALPPGAVDTGLAELARLMPLGLGMIMFGRAMRLLEAGHSRVQVEPVLRVAADGIDALRAALARSTLIDGLSMSLAGLLQTELLLCAAAAGRPEAVTGLMALGDEATSWRGFIEMVNAGRFAAAETLMDNETVLQNLDARTGALAEDARWAAMLLDLQNGRPLMAARKAAAREAEGGDAARCAVIYADAFIRLVNAGDYPAARELDQDGLEGRIVHCSPTAMLDALASLLLLDLHSGADAAAHVPDRLLALQNAGVDETRLTELGFQALSTLVNQAAFDVARKILPAVEPALVELRPPFSALARDALFTAGILALQHEDDWQRGADRFAQLREGLLLQAAAGQTPEPLFWEALRGEILTLNKLNRGAEATALLRFYLNMYPGAPDDLRDVLKDETV